jgi:hypothetical protein
MARPNLWSKSVPRVELDQRARDARVRFVWVERLLLPRVPVASFWLTPFVRLLGSRTGGNRRNGGRGGGSQSNPRLGCMPEIKTVSSASNEAGGPMSHDPVNQPAAGAVAMDNSTKPSTSLVPLSGGHVSCWKNDIGAITLAADREDDGQVRWITGSHTTLSALPYCALLRVGRKWLRASDRHLPADLDPAASV